MPRQKNYKAAMLMPIPPAVGKPPDAVPARPATARIVFTELLGVGVRTPSARGIDLTEWLGRGIDEWVWAALDCYVAKLRSGTCQTSTVHNESRGVAKFFEFLLDGRGQPLLVVPGELRPLHVTQFVGWLQRRQEARGLSSESTRSVYKGAKSTFVTLMHHGLIEGDPKLFFPARALPNKNFASARAQPYSDAEQQRLADALRADLIDVHHGRLHLAPSAVLVTYFLVVAMRTGCNLTPLLEVARDAIRPGLVPGTQFLRLRKHRGARIVSRVLKEAERDGGETLVIPMDAVAVLERALDETAELASHAPPHLTNRVWLFRSLDSRQRGVIMCLRRETIITATRSMAKRRNLLDDSGKPLLVATTRLRQSLGKRAWRLSEGDPVAVAAILGNTPRVADSNYLRIDEQLQAEAASYMGRELSVHLRAGADGRRTVPLVVNDGSSTSTLTPTGRCKNSMFGAYAPKDGGNHCDQFVMCLFCPSFAVAGESNDLWRLYSFQRYAMAELDHLAALNGDQTSGVAERDDLRLLYEAAIPFIDRFCEQSFGKAMCVQAKHRVQSEVHPFWQQLMKRSAMRRDGVPLHDTATGHKRSEGSKHE